jgi:hypothetical protein
MKTKMLIVVGLVLTAGGIVMWTLRQVPDSGRHGSQMAHSPSPPESSQSEPRVPQFYQAAPSSLPPVLPAARFIGKTNAAYKAVSEIPETIAQLPCYCHCDKAHGHKSLYSCFETDHAASCAVCVDEALLAYRLEKEEKLKPDQIRDRIITQYSRL